MHARWLGWVIFFIGTETEREREKESEKRRRKTKTGLKHEHTPHALVLKSMRLVVKQAVKNLAVPSLGVLERRPGCLPLGVFSYTKQKMHFGCLTSGAFVIFHQQKGEIELKRLKVDCLEGKRRNVGNRDVSWNDQQMALILPNEPTQNALEPIGRNEATHFSRSNRTF